MTSYVIFAIIACWIVFITVWVVMAFSAKRYVYRGSWGLGIRVLVLLALVVLFKTTNVREFFLNEQSINPALQWIGVVICAAGVAFAIWARLYLGSNWGMPMSLKKDAELVTSGPYAYVRHPIYTGMIMAMIGTTLVTIYWIIPFIGSFIYFVWAAKREEKIMRNEFPNQYPDYMKRTKMLIPFIF